MPTMCETREAVKSALALCKVVGRARRLSSSTRAFFAYKYINEERYISLSIQNQCRVSRVAFFFLFAPTMLRLRCVDEASA